jgi:rod shape determining protein RodA
MIDRRYLQYADWVSFFIIITISLIGLAMVFSATYRPEEPYSLFFKKQLFGVISGLVMYILCCWVDYRVFERWGYFLYYVIAFLLAVTIIKGIVSKGGQRWIDLGIFKFQPSELAKIFFAPYLSYYLITERATRYTLGTFMPVIVLLVVSSFLILKQPDLGTALIVLFSGIVALWLAGLNKKFFLACSIIGLILTPLGFSMLKPYQKARIAVFFGQGDKHKERYQIEQSQIAIGSGGAWGKGFLKGTQNKLHFLPEGRTDFIFSVLCEEWGFAGALLIITLYLFLFYRLLNLISQIKNFYAQILAVGLVIPLVFSTIINICMTIGLLPTVGIPLPFMTYGISHLWMSYIALGFVQNIMMRRFFIAMYS